ncbi:MAG TPA: DUF4905 domain-containing protein [Cyclobacteriaceae bacterium]|nr:DUF4905 domain-containing protein [Cyclobacteriaceae bacterium]
MLVQIKQKFKHKIWNLDLHPDRPLLFIESRDELKAEAYFSAYNLNEKNWLFEEMLIVPNWWCSMAAMNDTVVYLHVFKDGANPEPDELIAFDFTLQQELWRKKGARFGQVFQEGIGIWLEAELVCVDYLNGKPLNLAPLIKETAAAVVNPVVYNPESTHYQTLGAFIKSRKDHDCTGHIEYAETSNCMALAYYVQDAGALANYLLLLNRSGEELLFETLGRNFVALGWNTFCMYKSWMIYVKDKSELNIININEK